MYRVLPRHVTCCNSECAYSWSVAAERLLTYSAAAKHLGISPKAFRDRVARGSIPGDLLFKRSRGEGRLPECFVRYDPFIAWHGGAVVRSEES